MKKKLLFLMIPMMGMFSLNAQLTESFDGAVFPPAGWTNVHTTGPNTAAQWERAGAGTLGGDLNDDEQFTVDPHSGSGMAIFSSYDFEAGNGANLISSAVNLSTTDPYVITFWMYRDNTYTNPDSISVYVNTTPSKTGASFLGKITRKRSFSPVEAGPNGWYQYSYAIPASFNTATNYFIFSAVSSFGNNMFIDDIQVAVAPTCGTPAIGNITAFNYGAGTATMNWTASPRGIPSGYQWALNTTGVAPVTGTPVSGTSLNLTGITPNVVNTFFLRTDCGAGNFSGWTKRSFAAVPCPVIAAPTNGTNNVSQEQIFSWGAVTGIDNYTILLGDAPGNEGVLGSLSGTSVSLAFILEPNTSYSWLVVPSIEGNFPPAICNSNTFTTGAEPVLPPNNPCSGAINITPANNAANRVNGTTIGATLSTYAADCNGASGSTDDDVWYQFTTTAATPAGTITVAPTTTADAIEDIVVEIYAGTNCNNLLNLATCQDENADGAEVINLANLQPNTHYFMKVFSFDDGDEFKGTFTIEVAAGSTLPVNLVTFTAQKSNNVNILKWSTEQEANTGHFEVERSKDGNNFASIGKVSAAGNSTTLRHYNFVDQNPANGDNYYRLRIVDIDNSSKFSDVRHLTNNGRSNITIYPNPANDKVTVAINTGKATEGKMVITDMSGKVIQQKMLQLPLGNNSIPVNVQRLSAGAYIMKIQLNEEVIVRKFNKQ